MESHILNTYHQARYRSIGHKIMRVKSDSVSSSEGYNHNSPEYARQHDQHGGFVARTHSDDSNGEDWCRNQMINTTQSSQDTTSDEDSSQDVDDEDNIVVQEINVNDVDVEVDDELIDVEEMPRNRNLHFTDSNIEDSLVEGHDYDVITVYTVNPDLDLIEASSEDEKEQVDCINEIDDVDNVDYICNDSSQNYRVNYLNKPAPDIRQRVMDMLSRPVEPNVDEYLLKNKSILDGDGPVVKDVDEYFIKESDKSTSLPNVEDFIVCNKVKEEQTEPIHNIQLNVPESFPNVDEFLIKPAQQTKKEPQEEPEETENVVDVSINESDLEVLPKIEDLKRYLLEDMSYVKFKNIQRSCSVPQSPMQSLLDIEDAKTCLSFEDLNLDLSDLAFDSDKDKSDSINKSDDIPRTLTDEDVNSFLITNKTESIKPTQDEDDLSPQDMEIDHPVETLIESSPAINQKLTSTPIPTPNVLDFCIEKPVKKVVEPKVDFDDFVDVEMCNDAVIPVLEANNLNSLLEQFEATEKLNLKKPGVKNEDKVKNNNNGLANGMRQQDAGVQLNKTKMRQILMPSTVNTSMRSPSPVYSDHDYCSTKKRHSLPNLKSGQSLLKPEVLSSNSRILNSRHRSCKDKRVVYHLSSDDESEKNVNKNKKNNNRVDDSDVKKKIIKQPIKPPVQSNCRKKLSPVHSLSNDFKEKDNTSVMTKTACTAADVPCSVNSNISIKFTIKNKSEVILNNCDLKDSQKQKPVDKCKSSVNNSDSTLNSVKVKQEKNKDLDRIKNKTVNNVEKVSVKEEPRPKDEHFYTALFSNKKDVEIPKTVQIKSEKRLFDDELNKIEEDAIKKELEQPLKKKKLNFQEYKLRRGVNSNNNSATVSPEAIFPDMPSPTSLDKVKLVTPKTSVNSANVGDKPENETPKTFFDPIREASRKILMNTKKQKAEAMRKRDEDIVMSKIPKVENLQLQPLISDAEMMKIVGMAAPEIVPTTVMEKPQPPLDCEELILVSVGTNTDDNVFKQLEAQYIESKRKSLQMYTKSLINFKIRKSEHILKQNIFETLKRDRRSPVDEKKQEAKIDKARFKDITATLKSVEKQVDTKISSNSLFASIQDVVMKKAPDEVDRSRGQKSPKSKSPEKKQSRKQSVIIVREYDCKAEHGEDKVILHLAKDRSLPQSNNIEIQTDQLFEISEPVIKEKRQRNDSDMSMSSEGSPRKEKQAKSDGRLSSQRTERVDRRDESKEKRSRSKDRYDLKYRKRSRSVSRGRRRRRSLSRSRSRSRGRYRRYRRSDSSYKRKRRSPYHKRRSSSTRRERRSSSRSKTNDRSKSPVAKKAKSSPQRNVDKKPVDKKSMTPPLRKPTVSESSDSSTSSLSSSSSSSSASSDSSKRSSQSQRSCSPYKREETFKKKPLRSFSSEDRDNNTPVEERRIVFVGRLEKDITKLTLRNQFTKFGQVVEVRLHSKEDGSRYGFVTYKRARDAWSAVEAANSFPQYDVGFGGRRAFCRQSYADLDGLEAKYTESAFHGQAAVPSRRPDDMSFEQMLLDMKKKLNQRKNEKKRPDDGKP